MKLKVFYHPNQTARANKSFSPSAIKPAEVLKSWQARGLAVSIGKFKPLSRRQIAMAHDPKYVGGVLDLRTHNGFGNRMPEIRDTLRWTTGSFFAAAQYALKTGKPAASLTSGFHHAGYYNGGGFCTFNGLMVAAIMLKRRRVAKRIAILDLDAHYGNGTEDIIRKLDIDYVKHFTFGGASVTRANSEEFMKELPNIVCSFKDCDVILYQAGADPHVDDPLGGVLTSEQMQRRDRIVFQMAKKIGVPVAWNLAGGYQDPLRKVLDIHDATAIECLKVYGGDL